jgi:hypothetical protein
MVVKFCVNHVRIRFSTLLNIIGSATAVELDGIHPSNVSLLERSQIDIRIDAPDLPLINHASEPSQPWRSEKER